MLDFNWIDYLLLITLLFYAYEGYAGGFIATVSDLINFILSFVVGLKFYGFFGSFLVDTFSIPSGFSNAIGFFIATLLTQIIIGILIKNYFNFKPLAFNKLNGWLGIMPGILSGAILISFILMLVIALPVPMPVKRSISSSIISKELLSRAQVLEKDLNLVFGQAINETINFLTVEPKSNEIVSLNFQTKNSSPDPVAERYMFSLINKERKSAGLREVVFDDLLRDVGRAHCKDMFERGYFSHFTPEGFSPFDRMDDKGIIYNFAGENLALSPNTDIAMKGLMNSPGHKANILSENFGRVGVGVMNGGIYGEMFCQEFTD